MEGICNSGNIDRRIILFLEQGYGLLEITRKTAIPLGTLKVIFIDLAERRISINESIDKKISMLGNQFINEIMVGVTDGKSVGEISKESGISLHYINKIINLKDINEKIPEYTKEVGKFEERAMDLDQGIKKMRNKIRRKVSKPKRKIYYLTKKFGMQLLERLKSGETIQHISKELKLSPNYIRTILKALKKRRIIKTNKVVDLRPRLNKNKKERILLVKKLYDELGTLENVAKELNISRERIRQLLEAGNENNLFIYDVNKKIEDLTKQISKNDIVQDLVLYGSMQRLGKSFNLTRGYIQKLLDFYSIDAEYLRRLSRDKRDLKQYQEIVDFLGHHPTTTELSKKKEWRNLWHRIYHNWESFDNFRKEYGIPMPPKGYSKFREKALPIAIEATRKKGRENRDKIKLEILGLLSKQIGTKLAAHKIAGLINKNEMTVRRCLLELSKENKIDVIKEPKGTYYFLKEPVCV